MSGFKTYYYLMFLIPLLLLGCKLPQGCVQDFANLKRAQIGTGRARLSRLPEPKDQHKTPDDPDPDQPDPDNEPPDPPLPCTEFSSILVAGEEHLIFVDANALGNHALGDSWPHAFRTIRAATTRAKAIRDDELALGQASKKISIIIAGGSYVVSQENLGVSIYDLFYGTIIGFAGYEQIDIRGGYRNGDRCLELANNIARDAAGAVGRESILDGENQSNHLVEITGNAKNISLSNLTITRGRAVFQDLLEPERQWGGGVLIRGDAESIFLDELTIKESHARDKGGCLAIVGDARDIRAHKLSLKRCNARHAGGGAYIGQNAHRITVSASKIEECFNILNGKGGGVAILDRAGRDGADGNIYFHDVTIDDNRSPGVGGGIAIGGKAHQIMFAHLKARNNDASFGGGGLVIEGDDVGKVGITGGSISANKAQRYGAGIFINGAGVLTPIPPHERFELNGVKIDNNQLTGNAGDEKGAGLMVMGPSKGLVITGGTIEGNQGNADGIGVALVGQVTDVVFDNVDIKNNRVLDGVYRKGAGLLIANTGADRPENISIVRGTVGQHHGQDGAGLFALGVKGLSLDGVAFDHNESEENGGAIFVQNSHITRHRALNYTSNSAHKGAAIYADGSMDAALINADQPFPMEQIDCAGNAAFFGGCAHISRSPNTVIAGGTYQGNGIHGLVGEGGAIRYESNSLAGGNDVNAKLVVNGDVFFMGNNSRTGAALFTVNTFDIYIHDAKFHDNHVDRSGGAISADFSNAHLALDPAHHLGAVVNLQNAMFTGNFAFLGDGGAISFERLQAFIVNDTRFSGNYAQHSGGAVSIKAAGMVVLNNSDLSIANLFLSLRERTRGRPPNLAGERIAQVINNRAIEGNGGAFSFEQIEDELSIHNPWWFNNQALNGNGGALSVPLMGGDAKLESPLLQKNQAGLFGGGLYFGDMQGHDLTLRQNDVVAGVAVDYLLRPLERLIGLDRTYNLIEAMGTAEYLDRLNNVDPLGQMRGMFLMEANVAGRYGGALYAGNPGDVKLEGMSFGHNKAVGGGTVYIGGLKGRMDIDRSIIYGGIASGFAGGVAVDGSLIVNDPRELSIRDSSIQYCESQSSSNIDGSAGVLMTDMNVLELRTSNFFHNYVLNPQAAKSYAAALKFLTRIDPLPAINAAYNPALPVSAANEPLLPGGRVPVKITGPIILNDNRVFGAAAAPSIGTISIPAAIHGVSNYFIYNDNPFPLPNLNFPPPASFAPHHVVIAH